MSGKTLTALSVADIDDTINHEPRIHDLRLAETLGFARPRKIRDLIEQHRQALLRFGDVTPHSGAKPPKGSKGGRPEGGWWLTKRQALFICTKSETANATEATIQMVEVFDAFLAGRLRPVEPPADFTHKTVSVKAHTRRLHRLDPRQLSLPAPLNKDGLGVLMVDGKPVMFDANDKGRPGDTIVYWYSGRVSVGVRHENAQYDGRAMIPYVDGLSSWATNGKLDAPVIGRVVERRAT